MRRMWVWCGAFSVLMAIGAACMEGQSAVSKAHSILFYKGLGLHYIYRMNADGSGQAPLNDAWTCTRRLALSPDGRTIAVVRFGGRRPSGFHIYTLGDDGGNQTWLVPGTHPAWSPTGDRMAFYHAGLCVLDTRSGAYSRLVASTIAGPYMIDRPVWSPDGTRIAFAVLTGIEQGRLLGNIYLINPDGSGCQRLTSLHSSYAPTWSPDGGRIAFSGGMGLDDGLYTVNSDGAGLKRLTDRRPTRGNIAWSPDGKRIALAGLDEQLRPPFSVDTPGEAKPASKGLHVINADGSGLQRLTGSENLLVSDVTWSPDGGRIAFSGHLWRTVDIYVINADGTGLTKLTDDGQSHAPVWAPRIGDVDDGHDG